jgi:hypothetical protein
MGAAQVEVGVVAERDLAVGGGTIQTPRSIFPFVILYLQNILTGSLVAARLMTRRPARPTAKQDRGRCAGGFRRGRCCAAEAIQNVPEATASRPRLLLAAAVALHRAELRPALKPGGVYSTGATKLFEWTGRGGGTEHSIGKWNRTAR